MVAPDAQDAGRLGRDRIGKRRGFRESREAVEVQGCSACSECALENILGLATRPNKVDRAVGV